MAQPSRTAVAPVSARTVAPGEAAGAVVPWARLGLGLLAAFSLVACGGGGGGGAGNDSPPPGGGGGTATFSATQLLPLATGHRWAYQLQGSLILGTDTLITTVTGQQTVGGQLAWQLTTRSQTDPSSDDEEFYRVDADGIRSVPGPGADPLTTQLGAALVLRERFSPGDTWVVLDRDLGTTIDVDEDGRLDGVRARAVVTVQPVATLTAAGVALTGVAHLRTLTTVTVTPGAGGPVQTVTVTADDWYAPGIGPVRSSIRSDNLGFSASLDSTALAWRVGSQRSDTQAPVLTEAQPADGSTLLTASLRYAFSEAMDRRALDEGGFELRDALGQPVPGSLNWNAQGTAFDFQPVFALGEGGYSAHFGPAATDLAGNPLPAASVRFSVDRSGPVLAGSTPLPASSSALPDTVIELQFNEALGNTNPLFSLTQRANGEQITLTGEVLGDRVRLQPPAPLLPGATYRVRNVVDLVDTLGNLGTTVDFEFSVATGRFGLGQTLPGAQQLRTVQAFDMNGDGRTDLLGIGTRSDTADPATQLLLWRQQAGTGLATAETLALPAGCEPQAMDAGDLDADGRADVVFSAFSTGAESCGLGWLRQAADGSFGFAGWVLPAESPRVVRQVALAGTVRPALVVADDILLSLIEPEGGTAFAAARGLARPLGNVQDVLVGDLDGDGRQDLWLLGRVASGAIGWAVLPQDGARGFAPLGDTPVLDCRLFSECALALGPPGATGVPDLFMGFPRTDEATGFTFSAQRLVAAAPGTWTLADTLPVGLAPHALALADVDGDGRADLVTGHGPQGQVGVIRRRADGLWDAQALYAAPLTDGAPRSLAVADFNGDGLPDIVLGAGLLLQNATAGGSAASPVRPATVRWWPAAVGR